MAYGITVEHHDRDTADESIRKTARAGELFLISQPSAIDGNLWAGFDPLVKAVEVAGASVVVDLAYAGTVGREYTIDLSSPAITAVVFSLSKVFGVFYHRVGGVFSRQELPGLTGNQWFKNPFSLELGRQLCSTLGVISLPAKYLETQIQAIQAANAEFGADLTASDSVLIATASGGELEQLRRGTRCRICLTPSLEQLLEERTRTGKPGAVVPPWRYAGGGVSVQEVPVDFIDFNASSGK